MINKDPFLSYKEGYEKARQELTVKMIDIVNDFQQSHMTSMERQRFDMLKKKILDKFSNLSVSALCKHNTPLVRKCILCEYEDQ